MTILLSYELQANALMPAQREDACKRAGCDNEYCMLDVYD